MMIVHARMKFAVIFQNTKRVAQALESIQMETLDRWWSELPAAEAGDGGEGGAARGRQRQGRDSLELTALKFPPPRRSTW